MSTNRSSSSSPESWELEIQQALSSADDSVKLQLASLLERKRRLVRWREEPWVYMRDRLKVDLRKIQWSKNPEYRDHRWDGTPDPMMEILKAVAKWQWVAVESGTGTGKTFLGACLVLWFLECFEDSLVVTTAPKKEQLNLHIWREIARIFPSFNWGELLSSPMLRMKPPSNDWSAVAFVAGVSARESNASATRAQGFHAEHMLILTEETPGIAQSVMNAFENTSLAPHNLIVAFGNPDHQQDTLHLFSQLKRVKHIRISGFDHPNVVMKNANFIPGAQSQAGLDGLLDRYKSPDFPLYLSRARGISPAQSRDAVIRLEWCHKSARDTKPEEGLLGLGVDVANSQQGDEAAIAYLNGTRLVKVDAFPCPDANALGRQVHVIARSTGILPDHVCVDGVGVGAGTINELHRLEFMAQDFQAGSKALEDLADKRMAEKFDNLRSQAWWQMRIDLQFLSESHLVLPEDEELWADLCTPKWFLNTKGAICIEAKKDIKKRLGRSPNKGDAAVMANWARLRRSGIAAAPLDTEATEREDKPEREAPPPRVFGSGNRRRTW